MNIQTAVSAAATKLLIKRDPSLSALIVTGPQSIAIRAGTVFAGIDIGVDAAVKLPDGGLQLGTDYAVTLMPGLPAVAEKLTDDYRMVDFKLGELPVIGGFHYAPGGNAAARTGGDEVPAINPFSVWDLNFRPACSDPRAMTLVDGPRGKFWCDIYLTGAAHHADGTSKFGVVIADGDDLPLLKGERARKFDYPTAVAVLAEHGKQLLSLEEFFAAAFGVTEKTAHRGDPKRTALDASRTSKWGVMQATGSMWTWGHDGDPDEPRASFFGGSWFGGGDAGSRYAVVGNWPGYSSGSVGARGRSDHLQLD